jgi:hypothetical protein
MVGRVKRAIAWGSRDGAFHAPYQLANSVTRNPKSKL